MPLERLTGDDITRILAAGGYGKGGTRKTKNRYYTRGPEGLVRHSGKPPSGSVGKFEGKVGTMHRSRKGATRRNANGQRYYVPDFNPATEVVAYFTG